jgi:hypothetical protein
MTPSPQVLMLDVVELDVVAPPEPLVVELPHWHMPKLRPSSLQVWTPMVPPRQAQAWVVPGTQPFALVVSPPVEEPQADATKASSAPDNQISFDVTVMLLLEKNDEGMNRRAP